MYCIVFIQEIIIQFQSSLIFPILSLSVFFFPFLLFTSSLSTCLFISHNSLLDTEISDKYHLFLQIEDKSEFKASTHILESPSTYFFAYLDDFIRVCTEVTKGERKKKIQ